MKFKSPGVVIMKDYKNYKAPFKTDKDLILLAVILIAYLIIGFIE